MSTSDELFAMQAALTSYRRTFVSIGHAFMVAAGRIPEGSSDHREAIAVLERELRKGEQLIDVLALDVAFLALLGLLCGKSGLTPRTILDRHFADAPSDQEWRTLVDGYLQGLDS